MTPLPIITTLITGFLIGVLLTWLWSRVRLVRMETEHRFCAEKLANLERTETENEQLEIQLAQLQTERKMDGEKLQWISQAQAKMREAFEALASQILQNNSATFLSQAQEQVNSLLNQVRGDWNVHKMELQNLVHPLKENLGSLDGHVRELEQKREGAYQGLQEQLRQLAQTHADLQATTITLAQALKSPAVRGRWGEVQLRRVVEMAGMVEHVDFDEQVSTEGGRPDMIAYLPNGGSLPVDSKVPLESYLEAAETEDEEIRRLKLDDHARALQSRVRELGQKRYWEQFEKTPDFVVMFLPNDACLSAAFESDPNLLEYAVTQRVLIATPVTLLALLKVVAYGWQQHQITENARQIAEQGQELYRRLETFVRYLAELGKNLNKAIEGYNDTIGSFAGRLLPSARRFQEMGVATSELTAPTTIETHARVPSRVTGESPDDKRDSLQYDRTHSEQ
ncbi:MAG: DNA recombination protein RmuC [Acidobacteria bacterium]|nr:DNA recombination protein RmuC [Acidobacteriota bacterium]